MKRRETIFDFLVQIFMIFGITILCLNVFVVLFGEDAKEYSTMFEMGGRGLTTATMIQFLGVSVVTVLLKFLFFTDKIIKNMSVTLRTVCMFACVIAVLVTCIIVFGWFPKNDIAAWGMFVLCFIISAAVSTVVSILNERSENKKLEEALNRLKIN